MFQRLPLSITNSRGVALVLTLILLVLITILVTALANIMTTERSAARGGLNNEKSHQMNILAQDHAIALLRDGIAAAENTYPITSAVRKFWASQPGKITVFNSDGTVDTVSSRNLYSIAGTDPTLGTPVTVDLNQATFSGNNPIVSGSPAPAMSVQWINVFNDPSTGASAANPVVGRYAFWVDDESAKVNINTADGTSKYVDPNCYAAATPLAPVSFGNGMPTEISLQALTNVASLANFTLPMATNISTMTGIRPGLPITRYFNSAPEILLASGAPTNAYRDNNFSITVNSRSPELNIFGEPRIYLLNTAQSSSDPNAFVNAMTGPYSTPGFNRLSGNTPPPGLPLTQVYPSSNPYYPNSGGFPQWGTSNYNPYNQLPAFVINPNIGVTLPNLPTMPALPQYFLDDYAAQSYYGAQPAICPVSSDYMMGLRIAQYLKGYNSQGQPISWPTFPGSDTTGKGFAGKYTDRQIDSITLQILDLIKKTTLADNNDCYSDPYVGQGWLSGKLVRGVGRGPRLCQVLMTFTTSNGNVNGQPVPYLNIQTEVECYFPKEYTGYDLTPPYNVTANGWSSSANYADVDEVATAPTKLFDPNYSVNPAILGGYWGGHLLQVLAPDGSPAGIDLNGNNPNQDDPDQINAAAYHSYLTKDSNNKYPGSGGNSYYYGYIEPAVDPGTCTSGTQPYWKVGDYHCSEGIGSTYSLPMKQGLTGVTIQGGVTFIMSDGDGRPVEWVPLESIAGLPGYSTPPTNAVIPIPTVHMGIPDQQTVLITVADPLVNSFPGDWTPTLNPSDTSSIVPLQGPQQYLRCNAYQAGAPPQFNSAGGGDPSAYWLPEMNQNIPKSQRFPSVGYLQYIRTGLMPDPANDPNDPRYVTGNIPHGTPFRLLNFAPSTDASQRTAGGISYPDWAMLDLFTVPVSPQPLGSSSPINMTFGGSTPGRVNVNGIAVNLNGITMERSTPLQSVFRALQASNAYTSGGSTPDTPVQTTVDEKELAEAINTYLANLKDANGNPRPLMMPAEIANIPGPASGSPGILDYLYTNPTPPANSQPYESRNDLVRQAVGNLTTQSNTYSIWTIGQAIKKRSGSIDYGTVDGSDIILSQSRMHYIVERYIDTGTDGVPGNATANGAGVDGVVGTPDDVVAGDDTQTPPIQGANPKMSYPLPYKYRVVYAEEIAN